MSCTPINLQGHAMDTLLAPSLPACDRIGVTGDEAVPTPGHVLSTGQGELEQAHAQIINAQIINAMGNFQIRHVPCKCQGAERKPQA